MKNTLRIVFVTLIVALTFVIVQSAGAKPPSDYVEGTIDSLSDKPNMVVIDGTEIYGVKFDYLCNNYDVCLEEGSDVTIWYYEYVCNDGTIKYMASSVQEGDVTVKLRK